jgi:hypothetical protein
MARFSFRAWGDDKITSRHRTTLEITKEGVKTGYGDCIVATRSEMGLRDLPDELKKQARVMGTPMAVILEACGFSQLIRGRGDPSLTFESDHEMVIRKSGYVCGRTLMVHANKAAAELEDSFIELIKDGKRDMKITIVVGEER